jgi:hypothetical protein
MRSTTVLGPVGIQRTLRPWISDALRLFTRLDLVLLGLVLLTGIVAIQLHAAYQENLRLRWCSFYHDRNAHYQAALNAACELRQGHIIQAIVDLDAATVVWPLLHPLCLAAVLILLGPAPDMAVLPALASWCGTSVYAFLIARRLGGRYGDAGGAIAAILCMSSPALRAMGADVMLESMGLLLTLASIHGYLLFMESPTRRNGMVFGAALALIFLEKYNYWVLIVFSLSTWHFMAHPRQLLAIAGRALRMVDWSAWLAGQFRRPLNYLIAAFLSWSAVVMVRHGTSGEPDGWVNGFRECGAGIQYAYDVFMLRLALWWWPAGRTAAIALCGEPVVKLVNWAGIPAMIWLLLPFRFHCFLWYSSPANKPAVLQGGPVEGFWLYLHGFVSEYHPAAIAATAAAALAAVGVLRLLLQRDWTGMYVPWIFAVGAVLTILHPNQQERHMHTWAPLLWVMSGVGAAAVLQGLERLAGRTACRVAAAAAVVGAAGAMVSLCPAFPRMNPSYGNGYGTPAESIRDLHDVYLSEIDGSLPTAVFTSLPGASWRWGFMERFGHKEGLETDLRKVDRLDPATAQAAGEWLARTQARNVVYIDVPRTSPLYEPPVETVDNSPLLEALLRQDIFQLEQRVVVGYLGTVYIWKR